MLLEKSNSKGFSVIQDKLLAVYSCKVKNKVKFFQRTLDQCKNSHSKSSETKSKLKSSGAYIILVVPCPAHGAGKIRGSKYLCSAIPVALKVDTQMFSLFEWLGSLSMASLGR